MSARATRGIHARTHPFFVEGCGPCRWASVGVSIEALPTRAAEAIRHGEWSAQLQKDRDAYKTLRNEGTQPPEIAGCHERMMRAETREQIEGLPELWDRREEFLTGEAPDMGVKDAPVEVPA